MKRFQAKFLALFWIAWRNMKTRRKRGGLSFMTSISIVGIGIGVAALIVVLSVMGGFEADLVSKMLRGQPHLEIVSETAAAGFSLKEHPLREFEKTFPEAQHLEPFIQADIVFKQGKHLSPVTIFGVDPSRDSHLWGFSGAMVEGEMSDLATMHRPIFSAENDDQKRPGLVLGETLAVQLGANLGDEIIAISPQGAVDTGSLMGGGTLTRRFVVVGIFRTGLFNYDAKWAVVSLNEARKFMAEYDPSLDEDLYVSGVAINVKDPYDIDSLARRVKKFPGLEGLSWKTVNKSLLFALKLEKFTMGSILMLIVLVAAFSISGTMMMNVYHRRTQVALLRSLGMTRRDISKLFLMHGFTIGTVGIATGLLLGLGICMMIYNFQFINLPSGVYYLKRLPVKFLPLNYVVICVLAWLLSLLAATYPALTAAKQEPSEGLRW